MIFLPTGLDDLEIGGVVIQCQLERPLTGFAIHCHVPWLPEWSLPVPVVFMAAFDSIASVLSVAPRAVNLHLGSRHPFLWRIGAIEKAGVRSLDFALEPRAQLAKIAARFLPEDPTSAPSPGLVPEANAPCRCAYFSNGRLHPSRETEPACGPRSAGDREGLV